MLVRRDTMPPKPCSNARWEGDPLSTHIIKMVQYVQWSLPKMGWWKTVASTSRACTSGACWGSDGSVCAPGSLLGGFVRPSDWMVRQEDGKAGQGLDRWQGRGQGPIITRIDHWTCRCSDCGCQEDGFGLDRCICFVKVILNNLITEGCCVILMQRPGLSTSFSKITLWLCAIYLLMVGLGLSGFMVWLCFVVFSSRFISICYVFLCYIVIS
jgi:hypothetical protein